MLSSRLTWGAAVALALLATPVVGFLLLRLDRALERSAPSASEPALDASRPPATQRVRLSIASAQLAGAIESARGFGGQYAAYWAGRIGAREIADAAPELVSELRHHPRTLRRVTAEPAGATVRAIATLQNARAPAYRLAFHLERRGARWLVTRLLDA